MCCFLRKLSCNQFLHRNQLEIPSINPSDIICSQMFFFVSKPMLFCLESLGSNIHIYMQYEAMLMVDSKENYPTTTTVTVIHTYLYIPPSEFQLARKNISIFNPRFDRNNQYD